MDNLSIKAFVSLGSNSENAREMLKKAAKGISNFSGVKIAGFSSIYETEPQDYAEQPWFFNQVLELDVSNVWQAPEFLKSLLQLETSLGRIRNPALRYGPRVVDIDLLCFNNEAILLESCILPHPRMTKRAFVLAPLAEISPNLQINGHSPDYWLNLLDWTLKGNKIYQKTGV